ncbi:MAG: FMN-binding protein [Fibrobacter sp.]|nr:FMN-binding protein [Fibrobacter sp.]
MKDIIKLTAVLTIISVAAALIIALAYVKTKGTIEDGQKKAQETALDMVVPAGSVLTEKKGDGSLKPAQYWEASKGDDQFYIFKISSTGYSSDIIYLVSVDTEGLVYGMTIMQQAETPGLGSRVQEVISKEYIWNGLFSKAEKGNTWFTEQFSGLNVNNEIGIDKSMGEWHKLDGKSKDALKAKNSITAITGSTISTRAVTKGLEVKARGYLKAIRG